MIRVGDGAAHRASQRQVLGNVWVERVLIMIGQDGLRASPAEIIDRVRATRDRVDSRDPGRDLPFTTLTYAQSIDGSIARGDGGQLQLSNPQSQKLTHQVRALHDAILVGINTVLSDDPRLNVRLTEGSNPQPVVVDSRLRFPLDARLLRDPCVRPIIVAGIGAGSAQRERGLMAAGATIMRLPLQGDGSIDLVDLLVRLKQRGLRSVMVEGGAEIITSVLASGLADQFLLTIVPRFVGGLHAVKSQHGDHGTPLPQLYNLDFQWLAGDLILRGDFSQPATTAAQSAPSANDHSAGPADREAVAVKWKESS